jgi:hypothetical protein
VGLLGILVMIGGTEHALRPIPPTRCLLQEETMLPRLLYSIRRSTTNNIHHKRKVVEVGAWLAA